jgi:hypothetical protein
MPPTVTPADQLVQRAGALRRLASSIDHADAAVLYRRATIETWIGPTPQQCLDDLLSARTLLAQAADLLRTGATRLEARAAQLNTAARLAVASPIAV